MQDVQNKYNILYTMGLFIPITIQLTNISKYLGIYEFKNKYAIIIGVAFGFMFGFFRNYQFGKEMDKKYSAIWLKSIGKLDRN